MLDLDFPGGAVVKNFPAKAGDIRNMGSIPGSRRPPGEGNGNPLQYSRLENSMHRGPWRTTIHGVAESDTTEQLSVRARYLIYSIVLASGVTKQPTNQTNKPKKPPATKGWLKI